MQFLSKIENTFITTKKSYYVTIKIQLLTKIYAETAYNYKSVHLTTIDPEVK